MRRLFGLIGIAAIGIAAALTWNHAAKAAIPAVKIAPLVYQEPVRLGRTSSGVIDVSNPSDRNVTLTPSVQAFRQVGKNGDLEFYDDESLAAGVTLGIKELKLGPREAARVRFTIDPNKLKSGGVFGAIFFQTAPERSSANTHIDTVARVGTLLVLDVGGTGVRYGGITGIDVPWINIGSGIEGNVIYSNTDKSSNSIAFNPKLQVSAGFNAQPRVTASPLVLPGSVRQTDFRMEGNYFGIVPVKARDVSGVAQSQTVYVLAITGYWRWIVLFTLTLVAYVVAYCRQQALTVGELSRRGWQRFAQLLAG
jgi:hypothetical protein